jgi:hypothetical protein
MHGDEVKDPKTTWRPPTRRAFVAMLAAATTALAVRERETATVDEPPRQTWNGQRIPRWIGHC